MMYVVYIFKIVTLLPSAQDNEYGERDEKGDKGSIGGHVER